MTSMKRSLLGQMREADEVIASYVFLKKSFLRRKK